VAENEVERALGRRQRHGRAILAHVIVGTGQVASERDAESIAPGPVTPHPSQVASSKPRRTRGLGSRGGTGAKGASCSVLLNAPPSSAGNCSSACVQARENRFGLAFIELIRICFLTRHPAFVRCAGKGELVSARAHFPALWPILAAHGLGVKLQFAKDANNRAALGAAGRSGPMGGAGSELASGREGQNGPRQNRSPRRNRAGRGGSQSVRTFS
jgi:hypothetical protein